MKVLDKINNVLGIGTARSRPAPEIQFITDGLLVTATRAVAWFSLGTSNTDQKASWHVDEELDAVVREVSPLLEGKDCHLKIVWGRVDGTNYLDSIDDASMWDDRYADWLDAYDIAERHLLLGVVIDGHRGDEAKQQARQRAGQALGLPAGTVPEKEKAWLHGLARDLGRSLAGTRWTVKLAEAEELAWMISREMHRGAVIPAAGQLDGAGVAQLTRGRIEPHPDHLRALGPDGEVVRYMRVLALASMPEEIETPGRGEWLRTLTEIRRTSAEGDSIPVTVDASMRFRVMPPAEANKMVENIRTLAKEQRQSAAKHAAEEVSDEIHDTEQKMRELKGDLERRGNRLSSMHPRLIVSEPTLDELNDATQAVATHYASIGMLAYGAEDEQRELWLESLPGDALRVDDLGHVADVYALFGAWWWGGAQVGSRTGRMIGYQTGTTPGIVRHSLTSGARKGTSTTTAWAGRSGVGKTTAIMLSEINSVLDGQTILMHLGIKGDDWHVAEVAAKHGIPADVIEITAENSGAVDIFRSTDPGDAITQLQSVMQVAVPPQLAATVSTYGLEAITQEAETLHPSTWGVIQRLLHHESQEAKNLGRNLSDLAKSNLGAPVFGPFAGRDALPSDPGLWVIGVPGLLCPQASITPDQWTATHRASLAVVRAITMHMLSVSRNPALRTLHKVIVVPEMQILAGSTDGAAFFDQVARLGRAQGTNLVFDTQDMTTFSRMKGVAEQINTLFVFQLLSSTEQDEAATMLGREVSEESRTAIATLALDDETDDPEAIRHGHCLMRDNAMRLATVQWLIPDAWTATMLNTNPDSDKGRAQLAEQNPYTTAAEQSDVREDVVA